MGEAGVARANKTWTDKEKAYLAENWGTVSVPTLCKNLGRSKNSIYAEKNRLGLGTFCDAGDYITLNQLLEAFLGDNYSYSYKETSWIKNRGLPVHSKTVVEKRVRVIYIDEFWQWAEKNRSFLDFSRLEPFMLGEEPQWVAEQRRKDFAARSAEKKSPWSKAEDEKLIMLLRQHKYGYLELSKVLNRTAGAIQRRCCDLGIKERPVKADTHGKDAAWTDEDYSKLAQGIKNGTSYGEIGKTIGKSEKAVRGKVYYTYLTESADKVRELMGEGIWGDGAPVPTVKQALNLTSCRRNTKAELSALAVVLKKRLNQLGYDPYWQRFMCMNWDDIEGCTAGGADCDSCTEFRRIKPQYCVRCGSTFYERTENKFCEKCRVQRKKGAQRKWMRRYAGK